MQLMVHPMPHITGIKMRFACHRVARGSLGRRRRVRGSRVERIGDAATRAEVDQEEA